MGFVQVVNILVFFFCLQGEEGWEEVDDEEETIEAGSGSVFAPASDYLGEEESLRKTGLVLASFFFFDFAY